MLKMTADELIDESVDHYAEDPHRRAHIIGVGCFYEMSGGRHCAVGRCMTREGLDRLAERGQIKSPLKEILLEGECLDDFLEPRYHGHPIELWEALQGLHDNARYWVDSIGPGSAKRCRDSEVRSMKMQFSR